MLPLQRIVRFPVSVVLFAYVLYMPSTHALSLDAEKVLLKRCTSAAVHRPRLCSFIRSHSLLLINHSKVEQTSREHRPCWRSRSMQDMVPEI